MMCGARGLGVHRIFICRLFKRQNIFPARQVISRQLQQLSSLVRLESVKAQAPWLLIDRGEQR